MHWMGWGGVGVMRGEGISGGVGVGGVKGRKQAVDEESESKSGNWHFDGGSWGERKEE